MYFCVVWFLVLICLSSVGGVPIKPTQEVHSHAAAVLPFNDTHQATSPVSVGTVPLNDTHNATVPAPVGDVPLNETRQVKVGMVPLHNSQNATAKAGGQVVVKLDPPQNASAETLEELQEAMVVQEGDILIPEDRNAVRALWLDATVPYVISDDLAHQMPNIIAAFKMISDYTCIRFTPRTYEYNYIKIKSGRGCASFVGCRGGAQPVYYSRTCSVGNLCHELIHALGLHHEHTRSDRDQHISVQWQHIIPGRQKNFKIKHGNTLNLPYDINSIMHYGPYFFSKDGGSTMLPYRGGSQMGQRTHLSHLDVARINRLYRCDERMRWQ